MKASEYIDIISGKQIKEDNEPMSLGGSLKRGIPDTFTSVCWIFI